jgi:hypothetical protein
MRLYRVSVLHRIVGRKMTPITLINIGTGVAVAGTVLALVATVAHVWRRRRISFREAKLPHAGSYKATLDPDRPQIPPEQDAHEADTDLLVPSLDPDRPLPPVDQEADQPDPVEETVNHG